MSNVRTIAEAITIAGLSRQAEDYMAAYIASSAMNELWNSYDWRESLGIVPPFFLIPSEQDFGPPVATIPADFRGFREVYLVQTVTSPPNRRELKVTRDVRLTNVMNLPQDIGFEPASMVFRVFPRVPNNIGATDFLIEGTYKMRAPLYNPGNLSSLIPFDDEYFNVIVAGIKWAEAEFKNSPQVMDKFQYFHMLVDKMAAREGLDLGDPTLAPAEPLVTPQQFYSPFLAI